MIPKHVKPSCFSPFYYYSVHVCSLWIPFSGYEGARIIIDAQKCLAIEWINIDLNVGWFKTWVGFRAHPSVGSQTGSLMLW